MPGGKNYKEPGKWELVLNLATSVVLLDRSGVPVKLVRSLSLNKVMENKHF